jgi:lipopolysaccharide export LptBFGC system permease protein LptF
MKIIEPFGYAGTFTPEFASFFPHALFFGIGLILLILTKK